MISIYKITTPLYPNKIYIGSTKRTIEKRFNCHKNKYKRWLNKKSNTKYCCSYPLLKYGKIKLLETCDEKDRYIRELINIIVAKTIMKCVNYHYPLCRLKCRRSLSNKRFRQSDKRKLYIKKRNQSEKTKLTQKIYRQSDKYKLSQKNYESKKMTCSICNNIVRQAKLLRHQKSKKCQKFISKQL